LPIYDYRCHHCGQRFTQFSRTMSSSDEAEAPPCPECGSADTERVLSPFAVHGPSGADPQEVAAQRAEGERAASITPREQIKKWRSGSNS
jgi:putative FmdB family regulatory protein